MLTTLYYIVFFIVVIQSIITLRKSLVFSQSYLYVFLSVNFIIDLFSELNIIPFTAIQYNYLNIFNIIFLCSFYFKEIKSKYFFSLIVLSLLMCIFYTSNFFYFDKYNMILGLLYCTTNIVYSLLWIKSRLNNVSEIRLTDEPVFWISVSLLFWSSFFMFRIIPMYLLAEEDRHFLKLLKDILLLVNIIVYILFFIGISKYFKTNEVSSSRN